MTEPRNPSPAPRNPSSGRPRSTARLAVLAVSGALALVTGIGATSLAMADPTPTPTAPASSHVTPGSGPRADRPAHAGADRTSKLATALAERLHLDQATVKTALDAVREARADQAGAGSPGRADRHGGLAKGLAEKLGVDKSAVRTALKEARAAATAERSAAFTKRLDEAVAAGTLTRAEADAVKKAANAKVIPMGGGPR